MEIYQAIILGIVQGLTEFIPVSSSAHLNLIPMIFSWNIPESFDIALHMGTLLAICLFFFKDWLKLIKGGFNQVVKKEKSTDGRIFWFLVFATIPTGILSLVLDKVSEAICEKFGIEMIMIAIALIVLGIVLYIVDKKSAEKVDIEHLTLKQAMLIGMSQAIAAAFPGTSRSGITMTVARKLKLKRESAAKFSFLLSTPIILAAVLVKLKDFEFSVAFFLGVLMSFLAGLFVIKFLMNYLKKGSYKVFAIYRLVIGVVIIAIFIARNLIGA